MPRVSIILPTNRPPAVLERCLAGLARQNPAADMEVLVVYNGVAHVPPLPRDWPFALHVEHQREPHVGRARNRALDQATGDWVIFLGDDVIPDANFVAAHLAAHAELGCDAIVAGHTRFPQYSDETVLDRLVQTTSMLFFYDQMRRGAQYNFRHFWTLNASAPRRLFSGLRFDTSLGPVLLEDLELGFRVCRAQNVGIWFFPEAAGVHEHRYTLTAYLERERSMGRLAPALWHCNPDCFRAIYRTDLDADFVGYCRRYVDTEGRREAELHDRLGAVLRQPAASFPPGLLEVVYDAHLPLKRLAFRRGLLDSL